MNIATAKPTKFVVRNRPKSLHKIIPYIGCKAGFRDIFDAIIPNNFEGQIYDVFGGGGSFSFYACNRFGSQFVTYNDNNPVVVNLIKNLQSNPTELWQVYDRHYKMSSDEYYYQVRKLDLEHGVEGAGNFLYLAKNAFSGKIRFNSKNKFNSPIRKGSSCPKLNLSLLKNLSLTIKDMTISNCDYKEFAAVKNSLIYLDPPYFNNTNAHYNGVLDLQEFKQFLRVIEQNNKVILSEQNQPALFGLSDSYTVHPVILQRSLQYITQKKSEEIIAFNY